MAALLAAGPSRADYRCGEPARSDTETVRWVHDPPLPWPRGIGIKSWVNIAPGHPAGVPDDDGNWARNHRSADAIDNFKSRCRQAGGPFENDGAQKNGAVSTRDS